MNLSLRTRKRVRPAIQAAPEPERQPGCLVYFDAGLGAAFALREACARAEPGTTITAVYLDVVPQDQPLDAADQDRRLHAAMILAAATANARQLGVEIKTEIIPCHVRGPALVQTARERGNAAIFLGVEADARSGENEPFISYLEACTPGELILVEL